MAFQRPDSERVVITGVGLTAPNGNCLSEFRQNLWLFRVWVQNTRHCTVGLACAKVAFRGRIGSLDRVPDLFHRGVKGDPTRLVRVVRQVRRLKQP